MKKFISFSYLLRFVLYSSAFFIANSGVFAQGVGVGINNTGAAPHSSALLDVDAGATAPFKGLLIPRMPQANRDLIAAPATGLIIYQTNNTPGFYYYNGSGWVAVSSGGGGSSQWTTLGNDIYYNVGKVGIGTGIFAPTFKLELAGTSTVTADRTIGINAMPLVYLPIQTSTVSAGSVAFGNGLRLSTTGSLYNTGVGIDALIGNTSGFGNTAVGFQSLYTNTSGTSNTAVGTNALRGLIAGTGGSENAALGRDVMYSITTGYQNTGLGRLSLGLNTDGYHNTATGYRSLNSNTSGYNNTSVGFQSGSDITVGHDNIFIGAFSTSSVGITTGSNNIIIGQDVYNGITKTLDNQLNIGNLIYGTGLGLGNTPATGNIGIGTGTVTPQAKLDVAGNIKIKDGTQGVGKVLTSDANGLATWQTPAGGGGGVTSVSATAPLSSSGGVTPTISITSPIPLVNGGTGAGLTAAAGGIIWSTATALSVTSAGTSGQYLMSTGATAPAWGNPGPVSVKVLTSGTTYIKPAGVVAIMVELVGGGGGGGTAPGVSASSGSAGGGGGGGAYTRKLIATSTATVSYTYAVGAGGGSLTNGGTTTFSTTITANGGVAGVAGVASTTTGTKAGGLGGVGSGGDFSVAGSAGGFGMKLALATGASGQGGGSYLGSGGVSMVSTTLAGANGNLYGGGGSGGINIGGSSTTQTGGSGAAGVIIITEYK